MLKIPISRKHRFLTYVERFFQESGFDEALVEARRVIVSDVFNDSVKKGREWVEVFDRSGQQRSSEHDSLLVRSDLYRYLRRAGVLSGLWK